MKKTQRITYLFVALMLMAGVLLGVPSMALAADSSVEYEGGAEKFVFLSDSNGKYTDSDLFDHFKGVMPGDTVKQKITIRNTQKGCDYINIYMRAVPHHETSNPLSTGVAASGETVATMTDFLSQLTMAIWLDGQVIYRAAPSETGNLTGNVLLGSIGYGGSVELTVELIVPIELGNAYANRVGEVDWVFVAEERDHPEPEAPVVVPSAPATGDTAQIGLYVMLLAVSVGGILILLLAKGRRNNR